MAFGYYKSLTLDDGQAGVADSTNWPLPICLDGNVQAADPDLATVGNGGFVENASGFDIRPYADSGLTTPLVYELVFYDGVNGKLEMHVEIPTLSASTPTVIYLAFGDSALNTDGSGIPWDADHQLVQHYPDGSSLSVADSTGINTPVNNGADPIAGQLDGGAEFVTANTDYVTVPSLDLPGEATFEFWINLHTVNDGYPLCDYNSGATVGQFQIYIGNGFSRTSALIYSYTSAASTHRFWQSNNNVIALDTWVHVVITDDGLNADSSCHMYVDGVELSIAPITSLSPTKPASPAGTPTVGTGSDFSLGFGIGYLDAGLDEMRVSQVVRADSWWTANYNAQKSSSTFITWGALTPVTPGSGRIFKLAGEGGGLAGPSRGLVARGAQQQWTRHHSGLYVPSRSMRSRHVSR